MKLMRFTQKQNQLRYQTFLSFCTRTDIDNKGAVYHSREIIWEILIAKKIRGLGKYLQQSWKFPESS